MILTKKEAATVWCPMARVGVMQSSGGPSAVNDPGTTFKGTCIADGCAMWRWADPVPSVEMRKQKRYFPNGDTPKTEPARPVYVPDSWAWIDSFGFSGDYVGGFWEEPLHHVELEHALRLRHRRGYCGLAGKVEP